MQVTCSCGNKLFFGGDPAETQVCDRCGQTVGPGGPVGGTKRPPRRRAAVGGRPPDEPPPPRMPKGRPPITTRDRLYIASDRKSHKGLGCALLLVLALGAAFAVDLFVVNPSGELRCGHEGKESYFFGLLPFGHSCPGLEAIRYLDRARRAYLADPDAPDDFDEIQRLPGVGSPPAGVPYDFDSLGGGEFVAEARNPGDKSYTMAADGTVTGQ